MNAIDWVNAKYNKAPVTSEFKAGDSVSVHVKIKEGEKERVQIYEGIVIRIHNNGAGSSFTVRKVSYGVGVERVFPYNCPSLDKVERKNIGKVRRAKLYYLRDLSGKKARIKSVDVRHLISAPEAVVLEAVTDGAASN
jgi:large subunit ribosomal protein L19